MLSRGNANQSGGAQPQQGPGPYPGATDATLQPGATIEVTASVLPDGAATDASVQALAPTPVTFTHTTVTTSNSSSQALASNPSAKYRLFQNIDSTNAISIAFGVPAVAN